MEPTTKHDMKFCQYPRSLLFKHFKLQISLFLKVIIILTVCHSFVFFYNYINYLHKMKSYRRNLSLFFHSILWVWTLFILLCVAVICSTSSLYNFPFFEYSKINLFILPLMDNEFHLFMSPLISFCNALYFSLYKTLISLAKLVPN